MENHMHITKTKDKTRQLRQFKNPIPSNVPTRCAEKK
jgi:hypothetical protein